MASYFKVSTTGEVSAGARTHVEPLMRHGKALLTSRNVFFDFRAEDYTAELPQARGLHDLKLDVIEVPW